MILRLEEEPLDRRALTPRLSPRGIRPSLPLFSSPFFRLIPRLKKISPEVESKPGPPQVKEV